MACRFCFETDSPPTNLLISPCACIGTSKYVHKNCLLQWQRTTPIKTHQVICQQCKTEYKLPDFETIPTLHILHPSIIIAFLNGLYILSSICGIRLGTPLSNLIFYITTSFYMPIYLSLVLQVDRKLGYLFYWITDARIEPLRPVTIACAILSTLYLYSLFPYLMSVLYCYLCAGLVRTHKNILYQMNRDLVR